MLIDWIMMLPEELANNFKTELKREEQANIMRYVTSIERLAKQEGRQEGKIQTARENVIEVLEVRFGKVSNTIVEKINDINDLSVLKALLKDAIAIPSTDVFSQRLSSLS